MRLLIADDHTLFRDSLRSLVEARGLEVVGEAGDGETAVELAQTLRPDVVLMDLGMPGMHGLEATRRIVQSSPQVRVVVLTVSDAEDDLFEAIRAGAAGYLIKDLEADRFFAYLEGVMRGEPALTPALAGRVLAELVQRDSADRDGTPVDALTPRESEVLAAMVDGITTNRELAAYLGVSENTIKFHVRNVLDKLHLRNRAQAVSYALRRGLVTLNDPVGS